jgi:hypothetical protein
MVPGVPGTPTVVTLAPGATASAMMHIVQAYFDPSSSCGAVPVSYFEVYPPGQTTAIYVPDKGYVAQACTKPVSYLWVSPVAAGTQG